MTIRFYGKRGPHPYLSNFYNAVFKIGDTAYASVEHAYQSFKATTEEDRLSILAAPTAALAKRWGGQIECREDWDNEIGTPALHALYMDERGCFCQKTKDFFMFQSLVAKFTQLPELRRKLLDTGTEELVEASPKDFYWGSGADDTGLNKLGRMLMRIRQQERDRSV